MKIVYISQITIPSRSADSVQVMKVCDSLNSPGCSVELFLPFRKNHEKGIDDIYSFYQCLNKFKISWKSIPLLPERYSIIAVALKAAFSKSDLIFSRSIPAALICAFFGKKVIVEIHEPFDRSNSLKKLSALLLRSQNLRGVITNCDALKKHTEKTFPSISGKCIAVQNGANDPGIVAPISFNTNFKINVGYAGQLYKGKGVEIIRDLAPLHPDIMFHVVGGLPEDIAYWKNELAITKNVTFHGFMAPSKLREYIAAFDIVLAPYQRVVYGYEAKNNLAEWTSPMKVFDYMSLGKPIIASDLPFMREVLKNGINAILCAPENVLEWSSALKDLTANKELSIGIGKKAREDFLKEYTWDQRSIKVLSFINMVIKGKLKDLST